MVLPLSIVAVKASGWLVASTFIWLSAKDTAGLKSKQATECSIGPPIVLLVYRLLNLMVCLFIGIRQLSSLGPVVFVYFTVWNWWLLALFFALGAYVSFREVRRQNRANARRYNTRYQDNKPADGIERAVVTLYHVVAPVAFVIDIITWTMLAPALMSDPDPVKVAHWRRRLYDLNSYFQHGANAGMVLGEMILSEMPGLFWHGGYLALWGSIYWVWSVVFYVHQGRFIYPFLDIKKPYAFVGYLVLYALFWVGSYVFLGLVYMKHKYLGRNRHNVAAAIGRRR